jgi:hypothetical protein
MKWFVAFAGVIMISSVSLAAMAQPGRGGLRAGPGGAGHPAPQQGPVRNAALQNPDARNSGRLTPQERQQLKRDVNDHGRDIYRNPAGTARP